jgi:hypothetical protein
METYTWNDLAIIYQHTQEKFSPKMLFFLKYIRCFNIEKKSSETYAVSPLCKLNTIQINDLITMRQVLLNKLSGMTVQQWPKTKQ